MNSFIGVKFNLQVEGLNFKLYNLLTKEENFIQTYIYNYNQQFPVTEVQMRNFLKSKFLRYMKKMEAFEMKEVEREQMRDVGGLLDLGNIATFEVSSQFFILENPTKKKFKIKIQFFDNLISDDDILIQMEQMGSELKSLQEFSTT